MTNFFQPVASGFPYPGLMPNIAGIPSPAEGQTGTDSASKEPFQKASDEKKEEKGVHEKSETKKSSHRQAKKGVSYQITGALSDEPLFHVLGDFLSLSENDKIRDGRMLKTILEKAANKVQSQEPEKIMTQVKKWLRSNKAGLWGLGTAKNLYRLLRMEG